MKRIVPLLLVLWIVMLSLFVQTLECGHSWAFGRAARHDPTRVVSVTKQTSIFVFSQMDNFLTHAHALSESSCTAVQKNTNAACQFAAAYTADCGTTCALNACASTSLRASGAAGTLQNSQGFRAVSGTNADGIHLPDGGADVVASRLSRAAASIYLECRCDPPASSIRFRRFLF